jgi:lipoprotein
MKKIISFILPAMLLASCAGGNADKEKAKNEYKNSLADSIAAAEHQIDSCENEIKVLTDNVNIWLRDFTVVDNSREVESYYIFNGWQNRYPLQNTGLVARISNGERLEIIAALKGSTFNSIRVESGDLSAESAVVPHDQALNYRREGLNTVMFSGAQADSVARLIADNELNPVKIVYLENGKIKGNWQMPEDYKKMVSATWMLYSSRSRQIKLEGYMKMLCKKIEILRAHKDRE